MPSGSRRRKLRTRPTPNANARAAVRNKRFFKTGSLQKRKTKNSVKEKSIRGLCLRHWYVIYASRLKRQRQKRPKHFRTRPRLPDKKTAISEKRFSFFKNPEKENKKTAVIIMETHSVRSFPKRRDKYVLINIFIIYFSWL